MAASEPDVTIAWVSRILLATACFLAQAMAIVQAIAQEYPVKPIRYIIPQTPGSVADTMARAMGPEMAKVLGQPVIVENKPGAGNIIAYEYVAKLAAADGYTLLSVLVPDLAILPLTVKELRFDTQKDLTPVIGFAEGRLVLVSASGLPWNTLNELVGSARSNPGKYNTGAPNSLLRLLSETLVRDLGLDIVHVPYSNGTAFRQALIVGEVHFGFIDEGSAIAQGDKLRVLGVTGAQRAGALPAIPTFAELGHPRISGIGYSINVRSGTPKAVIDRVHDAVSRGMAQPEIRTLFARIQLQITDQGPEVAARALAGQARTFSEIAQKIGLQPQ